MKKISTIIGAGVMGRVVAYKLRQLNLPYQIFDAGHSCSLNSMPYVSLYGIEKGKSPLGDLLFESYNEFKNFVMNEAPAGVEEVAHFVCYNNDNEKMVNRFGLSKKLKLNKLDIEGHELRSYLIEPATFLNFLCPDKELIRKFVSSNDLNTIEDGHRFICTSSLNYKITNTESICSIVAGGYLELKLDLGEHSFIISNEVGNLIYQRGQKKLSLGATTEKDEFCLPNIKKLNEIKLFYSKMFPEILMSKVILRVGLRLKGKKRTPRFLKISENEFLLDSFYKNGWSVPFEFAKKIAQDLS